MILFVFLILILCIAEQRPVTAGAGQFLPDYISKENTAPVKGIFVMLIVVSHAFQHIEPDGTLDLLYQAFRSHLGQAVVAMFLFYSGFGIMESIRKKGYDYIRSIPSRRFANVFCRFCLILFLYLILQYAFFRRSFPLKHILLAFTGWTSLGNSNWYMFVIFLCYWLVFISYLPMKRAGSRWIPAGTVILTALSVVSVALMIKAGAASWYYNTMILFAAGCWWSLLQERIKRLILHSDFTYCCTVTLTLCIYFLSYNRRNRGGIVVYSVWVLMFTALVLLFTMKVSIRSRLLSWFGDHVFEIYMLQRIPMLVLEHYGAATHHRYEFLIISFFSAVCLTYAFDWLISRLKILRKTV